MCDQQKNIFSIICTIPYNMSFIFTSFFLPFHSFFDIPSLSFSSPLAGNGKLSFFHSITLSSREHAYIDLITAG